MSSTAALVIESKRLCLEGTSPAYAPVVFASFTPEITRYMFPAPGSHIQETEAFLRTAQASNEAGTHLQVVILKATGREFIGHGGLHHIDGKTPELGIWIKKDAHGHGFGREAVTALSYWALDNLNFDYLIYPVDRRNVASRRIPEALGGVVAAEYPMTNASGDLLDLLEYHITPSALAERREAGA